MSDEISAQSVDDYRVAQDLAGDWWVWRRTSNTTWTTFRRCDDEAEAQSVCNDLNAARQSSD